jgi:hypothetical protein
MSLEMAHKVIVPPKKNYIPQFLKQRDINSYYFIGFLPEQVISFFALLTTGGKDGYTFGSLLSCRTSIPFGGTRLVHRGGS